MKLTFAEDEEIEYELCLRTLTIYEQTFGGDMLADLLGEQVVRRPSSDPDVVISIDYSMLNWTKAMKALWAAAKTANAKLPPFDKWQATFDGKKVDMWALMNDFVPNVHEVLFHSGATDSE